MEPTGKTKGVKRSVCYALVAGTTKTPPTNRKKSRCTGRKSKHPNSGLFRGGKWWGYSQKLSCPGAWKKLKSQGVAELGGSAGDRKKREEEEKETLAGTSSAAS